MMSRKKRESKKGSVRERTVAELLEGLKSYQLEILKDRFGEMVTEFSRMNEEEKNRIETVSACYLAIERYIVPDDKAKQEVHDALELFFGSAYSKGANTSRMLFVRF